VIGREPRLSGGTGYLLGGQHGDGQGAGVQECPPSDLDSKRTPTAILSQPEAAASGAVGAFGVGDTLERPLVREPVRDGPPQRHVEFGPARPHP
jgi:hypothetical protein